MDHDVRSGRLSRRFLFLALVSLLTNGCVDTSAPTSPAQPHRADLSVSDASDTPFAPDRPGEREFIELARDVASSAGFYIDEQDNVVVYVADLADADAATSRVASVLTRLRLAASSARATRKVLVRRADFSYRQLAAWRDRMTLPVLAMEGVVYTDLNEGRNRLEIGLTDLTLSDQVLARLKELGVPPTAVEFRESKIPVPESGCDRLDGRCRPLLAGTQIMATGKGECTIGATVAYGSWFVTASHCTTTKFGQDGVAVHQAFNWDPADFVGTENNDPPIFSCRFYRCRYSDAATVHIWGDPWPAVDFGYVARTTYPNSGGRAGGKGSLVVDPSHPRFRLSAKHVFTPQGIRLEKIGRSTGWTWGMVRNTCVDTSLENNITLLCQDQAYYYSAWLIHHDLVDATRIGISAFSRFTSWVKPRIG